MGKNEEKLYAIDLEYGDRRNTLYVVAANKLIAETKAKAFIIGSIYIVKTEIVKEGAILD